MPKSERERRRVRTTRERFGEGCFREFGKKGGNPILTNKDIKEYLERMKGK